MLYPLSYEGGRDSLGCRLPAPSADIAGLQGYSLLRGSRS